jgi:signal transduction histidine kinase
MLQAQLQRLGLDRSAPPDDRAWLSLLDGLEEACSAIAATDPDTFESILSSQVAQRRSRQTSLFDQSPVPILQLDMSSISGFEAQGSGVTDSGVTDSGVAHSGVRLSATNQAAATLLGFDHRQPLASIDVMALPIADEAWAELVEMVRSRSTSAEVEFTGARPGGAPFEALILATVPDPFDIPDYTRVVMSMTDITGHKAEERRMHDLVTSKNQLLASVTDDLRSPLAEVIDFAQLLQGAIDDPAERRGLAAAIAGGAARVASIVEDLLVISHCELGDLSVARVPVNLSAQVAQVLEVGGEAMSGVATPGRNVEPRVCIGDPARVRQIIRNLVSDVIIHGGEHAAVTIHRRGSTLHMTISADSTPMPDDLFERVFCAFEELVAGPIGPDSRFMALSVARRLAIAMGGDLSYRHEAGQSDFEVTLPAAPAA